MALFPNIPDVPGLPVLPRVGISVFVDVPLLVSDAIAFLTGFSQQQWGIFQDGVSVVDADNVLALDYHQAWSISDYPVEDGGFETYNKVNTPFGASVVFSSGGSEFNRQNLLDSIEEISGNLELYDVVTPEKVYTSVNIAAFDYRRTATNGLGLMQVRVRLIEIRVTANSEFSSTQNPAASAKVDGGTVQPQTVTRNITIRSVGGIQTQ